jgi:hypothetical protein
MKTTIMIMVMTTRRTAMMTMKIIKILTMMTMNKRRLGMVTRMASKRLRIWLTMSRLNQTKTGWTVWKATCKARQVVKAYKFYFLLTSHQKPPATESASGEEDARNWIYYESAKPALQQLYKAELKQFKELRALYINSHSPAEEHVERMCLIYSTILKERRNATAKWDDATIDYGCMCPTLIPVQVLTSTALADPLFPPAGLDWSNVATPCYAASSTNPLETGQESPPIEDEETEVEEEVGFEYQMEALRLKYFKTCNVYMGASTTLKKFYNAELHDVLKIWQENRYNEVTDSVKHKRIWSSVLKQVGEESKKRHPDLWHAVAKEGKGMCLMYTYTWSHKLRNQIQDPWDLPTAGLDTLEEADRSSSTCNKGKAKPGSHSQLPKASQSATPFTVPASDRPTKSTSSKGNAPVQQKRDGPGSKKKSDAAVGLSCFFFATAQKQ